MVIYIRVRLVYTEKHSGHTSDSLYEFTRRSKTLTLHSNGSSYEKFSYEIFRYREIRFKNGVGSYKLIVR